MSNRINFSAATPHGRMLAELCNEIAEARAKSARLLRAVDAMVVDVGQGNTWTQLETELGAPVGQGQTVYNLIAGAATAMQASALLQTTDRLEQG